MRSFSPPAPAPTTNSTLPSGRQAASSARQEAAAAASAMNVYTPMISLLRMAPPEVSVARWPRHVTVGENRRLRQLSNELTVSGIFFEDQGIDPREQREPKRCPLLGVKRTRLTDVRTAG